MQNFDETQYHQLYDLAATNVGIEK